MAGQARAKTAPASRGQRVTAAAGQRARTEARRAIPSDTRPAGVGPAIGPAPIIPVLLILMGGYLAWFGVKYWRAVRPDGSVMWPSDPVKSVLQGKGLPVNPAKAVTADVKLAAFETGLATGAAQAPKQRQQPAAPGTSAAAAANRARLLAGRPTTPTGGP